MSNDSRTVKPDDDSDTKGFRYTRKEPDEAAVVVGKRFALGGPVLSAVAILSGVMITTWVRVEAHTAELQNIKAAQSEMSAEALKRYEKLDSKFDRMIQLQDEKLDRLTKLILERK